MVKRNIIERNCFRMAGGVMQEIPVGTVIEAEETTFGKKAITVEEPKEPRQMEVATPPEKPKRSRGRRKAVDHDAENN